MKNKAFTLIEILLSLSILLLMFTACVVNMDSLWNNQVRLDNKIEEYLSINRYAKSIAELSGTKSRIFIENHKIKIVEEKFNGTVNEIPSLQNQIESLNTDAQFNNNEDTNIIIYLPDGSIEKSGMINLTMDNDETNSVLIEISDWNKINIIHTNKIEHINE